MHTNDVSELEPVAKAQRAAAVAALADSAPDSVSDPQAFVDNYLARIAFWTGVLEAEGYPVTDRTPEAILKAFAGLRDVDLSDFYAKFNEDVTPTLMK